jgi:hypothetical protein
LIAFGFEDVEAGTGAGGGGGGGGGGAADTTKASMSGTSGSSTLPNRIGIASRTLRTMMCAAVEMSTGMLLRCDARRWFPLNSSNIALSPPLFFKAKLNPN